jgi:hypothetical protein
MAVKIQVMVLWVVMLYSDVVGPCYLPEDGGTMVLQNVGIIPRHYMASQPR